jgi:GT2 family glycosyltransferase
MLDKIGVGMVTWNAEDRIKQSAFTIPVWLKNFVIVNDGTPYDVNSYPNHVKVIQHETNLSVGVAKNTAIKHLMDKGCEHIFIIEDDILIKDEDVFFEYILYSKISGIKHLNFALHGPLNKSNGIPNPSFKYVYTDNTSVLLYPHCVGCFSYYHRSVIEDCGYMDVNYFNAWEHIDHTYQIIKKGYHPQFWYFADIENSEKYLEEIPNSIENSTIANRTDWNINVINGAEYFYNKNNVRVIDIPKVDAEDLRNELINIYNKK